MPTTAGNDRPLPPPPLRAVGPIALFLDLDGVLAPMAPSPDDVVPEPRRTAVLKALDRALDGRLAIVSGRTVAEIDRIADGAVASASGVHGLEVRRRGQAIERAEASPAVTDALDAFRAFAAEHSGVIVEDKGVSAGLHYRQAPDAGGDALALSRDIAARTGLALQPGHMVLELKTPGADKGSAVAAFMARSPFLGATPVMFGDDLTDEAGFQAAERLGGYGVLVGAPRETAARFGLADVPAVLGWLEALAAETVTA